MMQFMTRLTRWENPTPEQRFFAHISPEPNSGCWLWDGATTHDGYALLTIDHRQVYVHRWAYERFVAKIPRGTDSDHLCRVRSCVNPAHIEPVTRRENLRRGVGRYHHPLPAA